MIIAIVLGATNALAFSRADKFGNAERLAGGMGGGMAGRMGGAMLSRMFSGR